MRARIQQSFSIESLSKEGSFSTETFSKEVKPAITEKHEFEYEDDSFLLSLLEPSDYRDLMEGLEKWFYPTTLKVENFQWRP